MAVICYASTGSNTSPYETWAKAATSLATALAAATSGDTVQLDMANVASGDAEVSGTTTWTIPAGVTLHVGTQNGASGITTGAMGSTYWLGNSTTGRTISIACGLGTRIVGGLTLRQHGSSNLSFNTSNNGALDADSLYGWHSATAATGVTNVGAAANGVTSIKEFTHRCDRTASSIAKLQCFSYIEIGKLTVIAQGGATSGTNGLLDDAGSAAGLVIVHGGNISDIGSGSSIVGDAASGTVNFILDNVILNASFAMLATQTDKSAGATLTLRDCSSSGNAVPFAYANALGEIRMDTGIYLTAGLAAASWKITTTADASEVSPFRSPWIDEYKAAGSVTPQFEILRDGSATAYTDAEVWMRTLAKVTASSVDTTLFSTRGTGTNIPAGAGLGAWTGESGTAWSGKLSQGSKTLTGDGFVMSQICVGVASSTVYVDPGQVG